MRRNRRDGGGKVDGSAGNPSLAEAARAGAVLAGAEPGQVTGWLAPDPLEPEGVPELGLEIEGGGVLVLAASLPADPAAGLPQGARLFAWTCPPRAGAEEIGIRAWHLGTGAELAGSPLRLTLAAPPADAAAEPHAAWPAGVTGDAGGAVPCAVTDGLWLAAEPAALLLRYELAFAEQGDARTPPVPGIRVLAHVQASRLTLHFRPATPFPPAGVGATIRCRAWLPEANAPVTQAHGEIWLSRREGSRFALLRRLRRVRLFRRPSEVSADVTLSEEEAQEPELWISLRALDSRGIAALPPTLAPREEAGFARMEDARLEEGFEALRELVRLHGEAGQEAHPLLPPPRTTPPRLPAAPAAASHPFTEVVLPVYNGDQVVRDCLRALRDAATGPMQVIVVDDASRGFTAELLRQEVADDPLFRLHRRDANRGYTKSINEGVLLGEADWIVILNSDTLVTKGWLDRLHAAVRARPGTGMAGPLSNAATWQSIPAVKRSDGTWSTNDVIAPEDRELVQALLAAHSERAYPEFPVLNGFCTLIARAVFDRVGLYDEEAFPMGYGEETDLCLRARRAGFRLTVADDSFVYHHKSVSFGANRSRLTRQGGLEMANKHIGANIVALEQAMQACPSMARLRARMTDLLAEPRQA